MLGSLIHDDLRAAYKLYNKAAARRQKKIVSLGMNGETTIRKQILAAEVIEVPRDIRESTSYWLHVIICWIHAIGG